MSSSLHKQTNSDIDRLLELIRDQVVEFQAGRLGDQFSVDGFEFELLVAKRNTVYRIQRATRTWYAKIPSHEGAARSFREKLGADVMNLVSQGVESCFPIADVGVCLENGIIVTSAVPGDHMHTQLYRNLLALHTRRKHWILDAYYELGRVLAEFHGRHDETDQPTTRITALEEFSEVADLLPDFYAGKPRITGIRTVISDNKNDLALIHGNLRRENIILTPDRRIGLIDFEDCGLGSRYDDLSKICGAMLLTKTAKLFPWRPIYRALNAMLSGYNQRSSICESTLLHYLSIRVATQFALSFTGKSQTIARIPVSQRKTSRLLDDLLAASEQNSMSLVDSRLSLKT